MIRQNGSGFWIKENIFSDNECLRLLDSISRSRLKRSQAGVRNLMKDLTVANVARDQRLLDIAKRALGSCNDPIPYRAILFEKSINARWLVVWHQDKVLPMERVFDSQEWGPWSRKADVNYANAPEWALSRVVAIRVHLDSSCSNNGPLRLIPKSHLAGVMSEAEVLAYAHRHQAFECHVERGGVLAMYPLLVHASAKPYSNEPRRVLHLEYSDSLDLAPGIRLAIA